MTTRIALFVVLAATACNLPGDIEPEPVEAGPRWIAIDGDAIATANGTVAYVGEGVAIVEVDAADLRGISERMHAEHHRCGGFALHGSLDAV
jgi:hypothetical protein